MGYDMNARMVSHTFRTCDASNTKHSGGTAFVAGQWRRISEKVLGRKLADKYPSCVSVKSQSGQKLVTMATPAGDPFYAYTQKHFTAAPPPLFQKAPV